MKLELKNIVKDYPGCRALDHVSLTLESGKVYALLGKNGSGKSTLVKILAGAIHATEGEVFMDGQKLETKTPKDAQEKGIVTVYQEMSLVPGLTVAENIFLNRVPKRNGLLDWKTAYEKAGELLKTMGANIDPHSLVRLKPGESVTMYPYYHHEIRIEPGTKEVLIGEVSMCNDDNTDNRFLEPLARFSTIEEDEPPYRLLCKEYPPAKD